MSVKPIPRISCCGSRVGVSRSSLGSCSRHSCSRPTFVSLHGQNPLVFCTAMQTLLATSLVGSYPQPDWLIDREKLPGHPPPRVRSSICGGLRRNGSIRRKTMPLFCDSRSGKGGARHYYRRGDPAGELFKSLCDRARWHRSGQRPAVIHGPERTSKCGAANCGTDPAQASCRSERCAISPCKH